MKRIVLLGRNGQLGWELQRSLAILAEVIALGRNGYPEAEPDAAGRPPLCGDLANPDGLEDTLRTLRPDVVVNAAGYTAVDRAEAEPGIAHMLNSEAPGAIARVCADLGALFVHYSTDYVFDGSGDRPWVEEDVPDPLNVYGRTKLHGEERIRASGCRHLILRTSWLYSPRGVNFPKTVLRLAREQDRLRVVSDQFGAPTGADLLADVTAHAVCAVARRPELAGTYHAAAAGETSWFEYARFVIARAGQLGWQVTYGQVNITSVENLWIDDVSFGIRTFSENRLP